METAVESPSVIFKGDVPPTVQKQIIEFSDFHLKGVNFARTTGRSLVLTEAAVYKRPEDKKLQSRVVYQLTVDEGQHRLLGLTSRDRSFVDAQTCSTVSGQSTAAAPPSSSTCTFPSPAFASLLTHLRDSCSSIGLAFLGMVQGRPSDFVSQSIVTTYHAPAPA